MILGVCRSFPLGRRPCGECDTYLYRATQILFKWLNRKSQRKGYNWDQFNQVLDLLDWPSVRIRKDLNPFRREEAC